MCSYEEVLNPLGFKQISIEDNELAVKPRKVDPPSLCHEILIILVLSNSGFVNMFFRPPYHVSVKSILFLQGREKLVRWKRSRSQSNL